MKTIVKIINIGLLAFMTSCILYTGEYIVSYNFKSRIDSTELIEKINHLSDKYHLMKDDINKRKDTIGFFGDPYHYFYFTYKTYDTINSKLFFNYGGVFGNRKHPPYDSYISELNHIIQTYYSVKPDTIKVNSNQRQNKKPKYK